MPLYARQARGFAYVVGLLGFGVQKLYVIKIMYTYNMDFCTCNLGWCLKKPKNVGRITFFSVYIAY